MNLEPLPATQVSCVLLRVTSEDRLSCGGVGIIGRRIQSKLYCTGMHMLCPICALLVMVRNQSLCLSLVCTHLLSTLFLPLLLPVPLSPGTYLLSGGEECVLVLWQLSSCKSHYRPRLGAQITRIACDPTDQSFAISLQNNSKHVRHITHCIVLCPGAFSSHSGGIRTGQ